MSTSLWITLAIAILFGLGYVLHLRVLYKKSRELDGKIDFSKLRKWKDTEEES